MRIWRYNGDMSKVPEIDKKYVDYTSVKVDATILNVKEDGLEEKIFEKAVRR